MDRFLPVIYRDQLANCNAMSVDVEDYFHVSAFEKQTQGKSWESFECRIPRNVERILELFEAGETSATFFTLGWVAEKFPQLVRQVADAGHEIASHGFNHVRVSNQTPAEFEEDVSKTKALLEDITGRPVNGYRAASYSIDARTLWAHDVLQLVGYEYSSSIYPVSTKLYGMPEAPRVPFRIKTGGLLEVPVTTVDLLGKAMPAGGGGYFRLYPYAFSRWILNQVNAEGRCAVFYFHPWEIDPSQPRFENASLKSRFRHYLNLSRMETRLKRLLTDFEWGRMDQVFMREESVGVS